MIAEALNAYANSSRREWGHDRSQTVGASEIGLCARRVAFSKSAGDPDAGVTQDADWSDGWGAARRGSIIEDHLFVPAVRAAWGASALFTGDEQRTFSAGFLSATPDGLLTDLRSDALAHLGVEDIDTDCITLDCKSIDPRTKLTAPKPEHVFQVQVQIGLVRETTNWRPSFGLLTYIDASFLDKVTEFAVAFDPTVYATAKDRARQIMTARSGLDLRPEGIVAGGKECDACPYTSQCGRARAARVPDKVATLPDDVAEAIRSEAALAKTKDADADVLHRESGQHRENIRDLLDGCGSKGLPGVATWSAVKGRQTWDDKAIRAAAEAAGIDLSPFKKTGDPSDRLTLA